MKINDYSFGKIVVNGKEYRNDLKIFPDKVKSDWWRKKGHELHVEDILDVIEEKPDILIVGKGSSGLMKVLPSTKRELREDGIKIIALPTSKAVEKYNEYRNSGKKVIGVFHLTC